MANKESYLDKPDLRHRDLAYPKLELWDVDESRYFTDEFVARTERLADIKKSYEVNNSEICVAGIFESSDAIGDVIQKEYALCLGGYQENTVLDFSVNNKIDTTGGWMRTYKVVWDGLGLIDYEASEYLVSCDTSSAATYLPLEQGPTGITFPGAWFGTLNDMYTFTYYRAYQLLGDLREFEALLLQSEDIR